MLRFLILGAVAFLIYKIFWGSKKKKESVTNLKNNQIGDMVKDPVCGTYVSTNSDIRVRDGDKVYFFCSYECRDKFLKEKVYEKDRK